MANKIVNNFTGGEWTPLLDGRSDLEKYNSACRTMENVRPQPYGGATMRAGTVFIAEVADSSKDTRIVKFNFSTGTSFAIELGHLTMRFYSNGARVETSPGIPYQITTPWVSTDLFPMQFKQINDIIYFVHPAYHPRKLSRITDTNWTLAEVAWTYPPMSEENITSTTITPSATTGAITLTASAALFNALQVGGYFEIRHLREATSVELAISAATGDSAALTVRGNWSVVTTERWYGVLEVQRSYDGGSTWETIRNFKSSADRNVTASGTQSIECQLRLSFTYTGDPYGAGVWVGTAPTSYVLSTAKLECEEAYVTGLAKVTVYTSPTLVSATVVNTLGGTTATNVWSEGAWSTYRGYPRAVGIYEQRLYYAGTGAKPIRFWGSVTGDFDNFRYSDDDDAAVAFDIASTESNPIQWIESLQRAIMGSSGGEFSVSAGSADEPLTPSNISVRGQSGYGSELYQPLVVNDAVIFLQRQARKIREMSFDITREGYVAPDLTLLAEHITDGGVKQLALARNPETMIFAACGSGELAVLTYNREQNVTAWARYVTDGWIESVCATYGATADDVWVIVRRTINGSQKRYVELFVPEVQTKVGCKLLDAHVAGTLTDPYSGSITGLGHLEAKVVTLVVAGTVIGEYTVSGGAITTGAIATLGAYVVGLPYTAKIRPMRLELAGQTGSSQGRQRRISGLVIRFDKTLGCRFGHDLSNLEDLNFNTTDDPMDSSPPLFTGDKKVAFPGSNDTDASVWIIQEQPMPFTVLAVIAKLEVTEI